MGGPENVGRWPTVPKSDSAWHEEVGEVREKLSAGNVPSGNFSRLAVQMRSQKEGVLKWAF
jgi:hypothetical protein